jgi:DNA-binding NtrC family response regulator
VLAAVLGNEKRINIIGLNSLHPKSTNFIVPTEKTLREYSIGIIMYYLEKYNQNVVKVAEKLDIGKSTIYNMIKCGEITLNK